MVCCHTDEEKVYSNLRKSVIDNSFNATFYIDNTEHSIPFWGFSKGSESPSGYDKRFLVKEFLFQNDNIFTITFQKKYNTNIDSTDYKHYDNLSKENLKALINPGLYEIVSPVAFYYKPEGIILDFTDKTNYDNGFYLSFHKTLKNKDQLTGYIEIKPLDFVDHCNLIFMADYYYTDTNRTISGDLKGFIYNNEDIQCPFDNGN